MDKNKLVSRFVIITFILLYALVSIISTIHVVDFFELSNPYWLAVTLAIGFELGAAASLASLVILEKTNKTLVWALFLAITLMQMQGNMFYAFTNLGSEYVTWSELFGLIEEEPLYQKRVLAAVSGAILPLVALGFIKSLVDYIKPEDTTETEPTKEDIAEVASDSQLDFDEEEWDEMHAHDMVLNQMVSEVDPFEEEDDEEDLLQQALEEKAEEEKQAFLKQNENDSEAQV
jgi:hypothetical protein